MSETRIELLKDHKHAGVKYTAGAIIAVNARVADWLVEQAVAKIVRDSRATTAPVARGCSHCGGRTR